jgi:hypothetical protein
MPFITFSARDLMRGKPLPPAWYTVRIESVGEAPSKDGQSTNYPVEGTVVKDADTGSTEFQGYPLDWNFNSKAIGFSKDFLESFGVELQTGVRFDLNASAGKSLDVFVENDIYNGRTVNRVNHKYRPTKG